MESNASQDLEALALQIQALTTNVKEFTRQNQEMRLQLQQEENRDANRNEDEENINRRGRSRRANSSDGASNDLLKGMQKEMDELKNIMKEKTDKNLDGMVKRINSLFTFKVLGCPLLSKFHLPQLRSFNGLRDPLDHITTFKMTLSLQQTPDEILCRSFPTTLKGAVRVWFIKLSRSSIDDFEQLSNSFVRHFVGGQRQKRLADHLLTIKQDKRESLRSYVKRFNREVLEVDEAKDKVQLTTFIAGLKSKNFLATFAKSPSRTMVEMLLKAQKCMKYMNTENALATIGQGDA